MTEGSVEPLLWRALRSVNGTALSNSTDQAPTASPTEEDEAVIFDDSQVLRDTMMVYGSTMVVIVLLFCWARRRFPKVYNLRNWVDPIKTSLADEQYGFFSWIWGVYMVTDDELLDECGMDALCFVRIAQMGFKLA